MIISYDNLWKLLIDKRLNKTELAKKTKICDIGDIVSVRRD